MHIEKAIKAIEDWYEGGSFSIGRITTDPKGSADDFDQSKHFLSVVGYQNSGYIEDDYNGSIYFEYEKGKFISTSFGGY
jgi:hypothetical protein